MGACTVSAGKAPNTSWFTTGIFDNDAGGGRSICYSSKQLERIGFKKS